ncbi:MAG: hypothetical protein UDS26_04530, partial [Collinsella sp.]|nr:hypothetical protein [Collinsella sp.]
LLEVEDQVFGVHAAPIIAVYGVNDMAPWGHMYVNPGLTEPFSFVCHCGTPINNGMAPPCQTAGNNARPLLICSHPAIGEF